MLRNCTIRIINVVGARPNFMKIAPLMAEYERYPEIEPTLVHTGQHYDTTMSQVFFRQLEIPEPDINLGVGSASDAAQTAEIMKRFELLLLTHRPDAVLVVGDVNSTIACALVAVKMGVKVAHVEAGLRSFDRTMPEEINRVLTDAVADYLFVTEPSGVENLKNEGIQDEKVFFVGNVMIDTLLRNLKKAAASTILDGLRLKERGYALITLHRPTNVDGPETLRRLLQVFEAIGCELPVVFPVHPRTRKNISAFNLSPLDGKVQLINPLGYLDFLKLMGSAKIVLTDSGGVQEETTILKVPCLTLRANTERPITVKLGTNTLVGTDPGCILENFTRVISNHDTSFETPELWDGQAAKRIVEVLLKKLRRTAMVEPDNKGNTDV